MSYWSINSVFITSVLGATSMRTCHHTTKTMRPAPSASESSHGEVADVPGSARSERAGSGSGFGSSDDQREIKMWTLLRSCGRTDAPVGLRFASLGCASRKCANRSDDDE